MKTTTKNYDIDGIRSHRLLRQYLRGKYTPLWSFTEELRLSHLLPLLVRHYFGYMFAYLTTRFEPQWRRMLHFWRVIQHKLPSRERNR